MSVSQVKKRFGEMESYLGRDKEGLRKLKLLKDDVNVLRTSLAAAEEKAELAEVVKNAARDRADKAEMEAEVLRVRVSQIESQLLSAHAALKRNEQANESSQESESEDQLVKATETEVKSVLKQLRKSMRHCPRAMGRSARLEEVTPTFYRNDLSSGWSHNSLWRLGAAVALIAEFDGAVVVKASSRLNDIDIKNSDESPMIRHMVQWYGTNNLDWSGKTEKAGFARLVNTKQYVSGTLDDETPGVRQVGGDRMDYMHPALSAKANQPQADQSSR